MKKARSKHLERQRVYKGRGSVRYACIPGEKIAEGESGSPGKVGSLQNQMEKQVMDTRQIPLGNDGGCLGSIEKRLSSSFPIPGLFLMF